MIDDIDVHELRALTEPRTAAAPEDLATLRRRVVTGVNGAVSARPPWARRAWLAPVATAAAALAVVAAVAVAVNPGGGGANQPGLIVAGTVTLGRPVDPADALAELERAAAGTKPVKAAPTDQLHQHIEITGLSVGGPSASPASRQVLDVWFEVQGLITLRQLDGNGTDSLNADGKRGTAQERADFAANGAGPDHPTPEWLDGLSSNPDVLMRELGFVAPTDAAAAEALWSQVTGFMVRVDPLLPSGVRAALLKMLARTARYAFGHEVTLGGQRLLGVGSLGGGTGRLVLFDPRTARVVGRVFLSGDPSLASPSPAGSFSPGPVVTFSAGPIVTGSAWPSGSVVPSGSAMSSGSMEPSGPPGPSVGVSSVPPPSSGTYSSGPGRQSMSIQMQYLYTYEVIAS
ncbi:hypothetical protein [Dactylosporangium matsuzakiense]|uniref:Uncharacterized protein n=1 Tax=Dactylosporangium matsuzakiense TaxID=53360 RepID=A0A9W6KZN7_9ACTN|nr:hypothetical protein [Dactylosporangium matsuzakiense]UWZ49159.1 hypothetical protein Dmats_23850 [Dactylosporangium matsuzakiense]GLL08394.1 hypothetical protein GCM10017581_101550 [Dactylosporangium matsuzakiense]